MADWDMALLESLILERGDLVIAEQGIICPRCNNNDPYASTVEFNGRPAFIRSMSCQYCQGNGYIYRNARQVLGLITQVHSANNRDLLDLGYATQGDCVFSPSLNSGFIGDFDRITFTTTTTADNGQVIMRGAATMNENQILETDLLPSQDRLWYLPESLIWCEDENGVVYYQGADFTFSGNKIVWINSPDIGTLYSIKYRCYPEWIVTASPMERFDQARNLAQKVILRRKHVYFQNGSKAATPAERTEEQEEFTSVTSV